MMPPLNFGLLPLTVHFPHDCVFGFCGRMKNIDGFSRRGRGTYSLVQVDCVLAGDNVRDR